MIHNPWGQLMTATAAPTRTEPIKRRRKRKVMPTYPPGTVFGEWTLLEYQQGENTEDNRVRAKWFCRCSCGAEKWVKAMNIYNKTSTSCGHDRGKWKRTLKIGKET